MGCAGSPNTYFHVEIEEESLAIALYILYIVNIFNLF